MNKNKSNGQTETNEDDLIASMTWDEKRKAAVEDYKNGRPCKSIAQEYGRCEATISSWARQAGCPKRRRGSRSPSTPSDRDQRILRRRRERIPADQVAKEFSLSRATIFSVCKKWVAWVEPPPPPVNGDKAGLLPEHPIDVDVATALHDADVPQSAIAGETGTSAPAPADVVAPAGVGDGTAKLEPEQPGAHQVAIAPPVIGVRETEDQDDLEPGPFPIHALCPVMRRIAEESALVHAIPVELPGMEAVVTVAGALGKGWHCVGAVNGRVTFGNLYVLAGANQSGGKGASDVIVRPLIDASDEMADRFCREERPKLTCELLLLKASLKRLIDQMANPKNCAKTEDALALEMSDLVRMQTRIAEIEALVKAPPSYRIANVTTAALTDRLARNKDVLMSFSPEAGELVRVALGKFNRKKDADFDLYLSGYSVESYGEARVGRGDTKMVPCLSLLWLCQPCVLQQLLGNKEAQERGLVARCLMFTVEPGEIPMDDGVVRSVSESARLDWDALVRGILAARGQAAEPAVISCSPGAQQVFMAFHNESIALRNGAFRDVEGQLGRWRENAIRIAVGQCVADDFTSRATRDVPLTLTEDQARRAVEIARWCCRSGLKVQAASRRNVQLETCNRLCKLLSAQAAKLMTLRLLRDHHGFDLTLVEVVAQAFPDRLVIKDHRPPTGRPSRVLTLTNSVV